MCKECEQLCGPGGLGSMTI